MRTSRARPGSLDGDRQEEALRHPYLTSRSLAIPIGVVVAMAVAVPAILLGTQDPGPLSFQAQPASKTRVVHATTTTPSARRVPTPNARKRTPRVKTHARRTFVSVHTTPAKSRHAARAHHAKRAQHAKRHAAKHHHGKRKARHHPVHHAIAHKSHKPKAHTAHKPKAHKAHGKGKT